ncbi:hypothetical protein NADE_008134 [Nannochloris sp. 'desiccata']|nr:hypothetical protein NADE_008134 [Chlorella desiccata (nom. nud.)]
MSSTGYETSSAVDQRPPTPGIITLDLLMASLLLRAMSSIPTNCPARKALSRSKLSPPGDVLMLPEGCPAPIEVKEKREEIVTPLYLVPEKVCPYNCGSTDTKANSRGAKVVAYTIHGPMPATSISGTCSRCGYNRFVDRATCTVDDGASKFTATIRHKDAAYFMATPETAFQVKLLRHAWWKGFAAMASNKKRAIPGVAGDAPPLWALNDDRFKEALVLWRLTEFYSTRPNFYLQDLGNNNVAAKLTEACALWRVEFPKKWLPHCCSAAKESGCAARAVMMDGNAKNVMGKCAYPGCIHRPHAGNQYEFTSRYCEQHRGGGLLEEAVTKHHGLLPRQQASLKAYQDRSEDERKYLEMLDEREEAMTLPALTKWGTENGISNPRNILNRLKSNGMLENVLQTSQSGASQLRRSSTANEAASQGSQPQETVIDDKFQFKRSYSAADAEKDGVDFDADHIDHIEKELKAFVDKTVKKMDNKRKRDPNTPQDIVEDPGASGSNAAVDSVPSGFKTQYLDTTKGWMIAVRPCGIILNLLPMYLKHEGILQAVECIWSMLRPQSSLEDMKKHVQFLVYDLGCKLEKHVKDNSSKYPAAYVVHEILANKIAVDTFHADPGHNHPSCTLYTKGTRTISEHCHNHLGLPKFDVLRKSNTESQELASKWMNRFNVLTRSMTPIKAEFLLWDIANTYNEWLQIQLQKSTATAEQNAGLVASTSQPGLSQRAPSI